MRESLAYRQVRSIADTRVCNRCLQDRDRTPFETVQRAPTRRKPALLAHVHRLTSCHGDFAKPSAFRSVAPSGSPGCITEPLGES